MWIVVSREDLFVSVMAQIDALYATPIEEGERVTMDIGIITLGPQLVAVRLGLIGKVGERSTTP